MAAGPITRISDVIVPEIFTDYIQNITTNKSELIESGALVYSGMLSKYLSGPGTTYTIPAFHDLDDDEPRTSTDTIPAAYTGGTRDPDPKKITTYQEVFVGFDRNQSWGSASLTKYLAGADPMRAIADRVTAYWKRHLQKTFISVVQGVFADNDANPTGTEHVKGDLTFDAKGNAFADGVTNFTTDNFLSAIGTMGDAMSQIELIMVHSRVMLRLSRANLIQTMRDADNQVVYQTFMGKRIVMDDSMPNDGKIYQTWLFGPGAVAWGREELPPGEAVELHRHPGAGSGRGADVLYNRIRWAVHPTGHKYTGPADMGGPTNAQFAAAGSWERSAPERKQIRMARLITREA